MQTLDDDDDVDVDEDDGEDDDDIFISSVLPLLYIHLNSNLIDDSTPTIVNPQILAFLKRTANHDPQRILVISPDRGFPKRDKCGAVTQQEDGAFELHQMESQS